MSPQAQAAAAQRLREIVHALELALGRQMRREVRDLVRASERVSRRVGAA